MQLSETVKLYPTEYQIELIRNTMSEYISTVNNIVSDYTNKDNGNIESVKEIKNIKQESFVSKIFKSAGNTIARLFQKYDTMGYEVEKVYVLLKKYESDIKESNN